MFKAISRLIKGLVQQALDIWMPQRSAEGILSAEECAPAPIAPVAPAEQSEQSEPNPSSPTAIAVAMGAGLVAYATFSGVVGGPLVAAILAAAVSGLISWVVRAHSYTHSIAGFGVASLAGYGPIGLVVAYFSSLLAQGLQNRDLLIRVAGVALGLWLPVQGLPLSLLLALYMIVTSPSWLYTISFATLAGLLSLFGQPQFVLVLMVGMSLFKRNYGESALEQTSAQLEKASAGDKANPFASAGQLLASREKSNVVHGAGMFLTPLMGVGVGHSALASRWGMNPKGLVFIECAMESYNAKAILSLSAYPMSRTGLGELLNNAAFAFPEVTGLVLIAIGMGICLSLVITCCLGLAPEQPLLEKVCAGASLGVLCVGSVPMFVTALIGSYLLSKFRRGDASGFATLPLMNS